MHKTTSGFTLVELLIVIVVIAILATISIVAYNGIQSRANTASADSSLAQAAKKLALYQVENGAYPTDLTSIGITNTSSVTYTYVPDAASSSTSYCLATRVGNVSRTISSSNSTTTDGECMSANIASQWGTSGAGGIVYDTSNNQFVLNGTTTGSAVSPWIYNNGHASVTISVSTFMTKPAPAYAATNQGSVYFTSLYYAADKVTPVKNTTNYTQNGDAHCKLTLNTWSNCNWSVATGPNAIYMKFVLNASPTQYTSDNLIKNVSVTSN